MSCPFPSHSPVDEDVRNGCLGGLELGYISNQKQKTDRVLITNALGTSCPGFPSPGVQCSQRFLALKPTPGESNALLLTASPLG